VGKRGEKRKETASGSGRERGVKSNADVFYGAVIDFESGFSVNHHNDTQLFFALGAKGFGEGGSAFQTDKILCHAVYHAFDDAPFARLKIAEQAESAVAFNVDNLAGLHLTRFGKALNQSSTKPFNSEGSNQIIRLSKRRISVCRIILWFSSSLASVFRSLTTSGSVVSAAIFR
jgi:hypothetical protein